MTARILVVDDDAQIVRLLRSYLEQAGFTVLSANDGEEALHVIRHDRPDAVVLDVMMPRRDGLALTRLVRADEHLAQLPILLLTARVEDSDKIQGLELGADDYLIKPFNPLEVVARVRALLRRASGALHPSSVIDVRGLQLDLDQHRASIHEHPLELTPTEWELLRTFMQHPDHTFTRSELIEKALGFTYDGFDRTIDSHIKNLRKKIELESSESNPYIETVFGVGYRLRATS